MTPLAAKKLLILWPFPPLLSSGDRQ